jgi:iron complex transport system substrate-binding protein
MTYRLLSSLVLLIVLTVTPLYAQDDDQPPFTVIDAYGEEVTITDLSRIVTIGGAVTEVVYDLGMGDQIIAVDESSIYPQAATTLPQVGYLRFLSAEPILAYNPSVIITTEDAGPAETIQQLRGVGVPVLIAPAEDTLDGAEEKIRTIAAGIGKADEAEALIDAMRADIAEAQALTATVEQRPRVMIVFAGSSIATGVFGTDSGGHNMLQLVNADNAVDREQNYIPLTSEAIVAAAPDIILTTALSVERVGGFEEFLALPGISLTPAAQNNRIIYEGWDELYLFGFTPRLGEAILDLTYLIHIELPRPVSIIVRLEQDLQQMQNRLRATSLETDLKQSDTTFTVFAVPNSVFAGDLPEMDTLAMMQYLIVEGTYTLDDLQTIDSLPTLLGDPIAISTNDAGDILLNGEAVILRGDLEASNGVVHVIDRLIVPAGN